MEDDLESEVFKKWGEQTSFVPFEKLWRRAEAKAHARQRQRQSWLIAASIAFLITSALVFVTLNKTSEDLTTDWQSPTDFLLK